MTGDQPATSPDAADGLPLPRRRWAVFGLSITVIITAIDTTLINVALPQIARDLAISATSAVWVVKVYLLTIMVGLLPLGSLGERIGYLRVYSAGLVFYCLGALVCTLADSLPTLVAGRFLQGLGAAGIMSMVAAMIRNIYPRASLGRGIGFNSVIVATAGALGPTVSAMVLSVVDWPWLFAAYVPLALIALVVGRKNLPNPPASGGSFDGISAVLNILVFGLLILGLGELQDGRWSGGLARIGLCALFGVFLVRRQLNRASPLLPVDLLRLPVFTLSVCANICTFMAFMLAFIALPFYLQESLGLSVFVAGLMMTPWPVATALVAPYAGRLADRYPAGIVGSIGLATCGTGLMLLALLPSDASALSIIWRMALSGLGFGIFQSPNNRAIISAAPMNRTGGAGSMQAASRLLGQTLGAVLAAWVFARFGYGSLSAPLILAGGLIGLALGFSLLRLRPAGQDTSAA